jgi:Tfp pilus assembly PilM family ATPase
MALVVGLDIGTKTLTGAVFSGNEKKFRLVDYFTEEMEDIRSGDYSEDGEYVAPLSREEMLAKIIAERNLKDADIVVSIDAKDCVIREINVPFIKDEQIRKTVFFEAENYFTGFDLEDAQLEYIKIDEIDKQSRLIIAALRNDLIESRLSICQGAGFDPVSLDMDACALFNSFSLSPMFDATRTSLVVDMGTTTTKILLVENGELRKIRSLRIETVVPSAAKMIAEPAAVGAGGLQVNVDVVGGEAPPGLGDFSLEGRFAEIEQALRLLDPGPDSEDGSPIAILSDDEFDRVRQAAEDDLDDLGLGDDPTEQLSASGVGSPEADSGERGASEPSTPDYRGRFPGQQEEEREFDYSEYIERIGVEIQRSLAGVRLDSPIELICLTGGMADREEARRFFSEEFDVETVALDFGDRLTVDPTVGVAAKRLGSQGAVAVGLALKGIGRDPFGVDFRKGPFRYEHKFERVKIPLVVAASLLFLIFLQATFWSFHEWKEESKRLDGLKSQNRQVYEAFFGAAPTRKPLAQALSNQKEWKSGGAGDIPRFVDFGDTMRSLADVMKDSKLTHFKIDSIDFKYKIKSYGSSRTTRTSSTKSKRPDQVPDANVSFETDDSEAFSKVETAFRTSAKSLFTVSPQQKKRGDVFTVGMKLTMKPEKIKDY